MRKVSEILDELDVSINVRMDTQGEMISSMRGDIQQIFSLINRLERKNEEKPLLPKLSKADLNLTIYHKRAYKALSESSVELGQLAQAIDSMPAEKLSIIIEACRSVVRRTKNPELLPVFDDR